MKMIFDLDMDRCCACGACAVACMDQNDIEITEEHPLRKVFAMEGTNGHAYISVACMHCEDAPCIAACPVGCLSKDERGTYCLRQHQLHRLPQLRNGVSLRRPDLQSFRENAKVRRVRGAPVPWLGAGLCPHLLSGRVEGLYGRRICQGSHRAFSAQDCRETGLRVQNTDRRTSWTIRQWSTR